MKVLITGANGMVARAAAAHCRSLGDAVSAFTREEFDIADRTRAEEIFRAEKPDAVFNCAAYTDVDGSETHVERCRAANAVGVENLALAARETGAAFVTISTDYVFDGAKTGFYTQRDTPNPLSVYGEAKLEGEIRARNAYARSIVVRSGWIFGAGGANFLSVMPRLLAEGKTIKTIYDSFGTPTFAEDLAARLRELAVLDIPAIYHVTNAGEPASFARFAERVCELKGFDKSLLEYVSADALSRAAPRPRNSPLACLLSEKLGMPPLRSWENALTKYLEGQGTSDEG